MTKTHRLSQFLWKSNVIPTLLYKILIFTKSSNMWTRHALMLIERTEKDEAKDKVTYNVMARHHLHASSWFILKSQKGNSFLILLYSKHWFSIHWYNWPIIIWIRVESLWHRVMADIQWLIEYESLSCVKVIVNLKLIIL